MKNIVNNNGAILKRNDANLSVNANKSVNVSVSMKKK
jgi:hypothetical protein